jgi:hypothetical protein
MRSSKLMYNTIKVRVYSVLKYFYSVVMRNDYCSEIYRFILGERVIKLTLILQICVTIKFKIAGMRVIMVIIRETLFPNQNRLIHGKISVCLKSKFL